jgi:protein SCO1/2
MKRNFCAFLFLLLALGLLSRPAAALPPAELKSATSASSASGLPAELQKVGFDQRLNEQVPLDLVFRDETGKAVKLGDYFGEKPVILVLAYFKCPMLCTLVLNGVVQGLRDMSLTPGEDFRVLTVSFDPRETPEMAAKKKENYITAYGRPGAAEAWHFLTANPQAPSPPGYVPAISGPSNPAIDALTKAVGFRYVYDEKQDQFNHTSGIMILTPSGKISRYFYGIHFPGRDLRLGLIEASANKIGSPVDQILLYCFHYDPAVGKYSASILNYVRVSGALTVVAVGAMLWIVVRRQRSKRPSASGGGGPQSGSSGVDEETGNGASGAGP